MGVSADREAVRHQPFAGNPDLISVSHGKAETAPLDGLAEALQDQPDFIDRRPPG
jgi:hypothetical protein